MPYIGKAPSVQNIIKLDSITASATASYTMQRDGANYSPQNINSVLVSLNGIIQSPGSSFSISGSTITFASTLSSSDSIDFILVYGDVLDTGVPSDSSITNAKLNTAPTIISKGGGGSSGGIKLNCEQNSHGVTLRGPSHSSAQNYELTLPSTAPSDGKALITDGSGNLSFGSAGGLVKLNHSTFSGASSVSFGSSLITDTYLTYLVTIKLQFSAVAEFRQRVSTDNGSSFSFGGWQAYEYSRLDSASTGGNRSSATNYLPSGWSLGNTSQDVLVGDIYLHNFRETTGYKWIRGNFCIGANGADYMWDGGYEVRLETKQNYYEIYPASGTMTGYATLYGLAK